MLKMKKIEKKEMKNAFGGLIRKVYTGEKKTSLNLKRVQQKVPKLKQKEIRMGKKKKISIKEHQELWDNIRQHNIHINEISEEE